MNIIELHQDLIDNHNIHQFSIITGEYLHEIMRTYYTPSVASPTPPTSVETDNESLYSYPYNKPFTLIHVQEYIEWILNKMDFELVLIIPAIVYIDDFLITSNLAIYDNNWLPIFVTGLLLSQKMYDDIHYDNCEFAKILPSDVQNQSYDNALKTINIWEKHFLTTIQYRLVLIDTFDIKKYCKELLDNTQDNKILIINNYLSTLCQTYLFN